VRKIEAIKTRWTLRPRLVREVATTMIYARDGRVVDALVRRDKVTDSP